MRREAPSSRPRPARRALALAFALALAAGAAGAQEEPATEEPAAEPPAETEPADGMEPAVGARPEEGAGGAPGGGPIRVELNKLEPREQVCRVYLVLENRSEQALGALRLDLVLFGSDGVILRRLAVDAGPVGTGRTRVRLFDVEEVSCERIGRLLLNGVLACEDEAGEPLRCGERLELESRAGIPFGR